MTDLATPAVQSSARKLTQLQERAVRIRAAEIGNKLRSGQIVSDVELDDALAKSAAEVNLASSYVEAALTDYTRSFGAVARHKVPEAMRKRLGIHI